MNFENSFEESSNKKAEISPVPAGVNEKYFWDVVKLISGSKPGGGEFYSSGSADDIKSFSRERMKSGSYEPYMESAIAQAKVIVLDPHSNLSEEILENWANTSFTHKRDLIKEAYKLKFSDEQTHADLGDEAPTRLD